MSLIVDIAIDKILELSNGHAQMQTGIGKTMRLVSHRTGKLATHPNKALFAGAAVIAIAMVVGSNFREQYEAPDQLMQASASTADQALMDKWMDANDLCQGSSNSTTIAKTCKTRDQLERQLADRGWCWAYEDETVVRADYRWHRCTEKTLARGKHSVQLEAVSQSAQNPETVEVDSQSTGSKPVPAARTTAQRRADLRAAVRQGWLVTGAQIQRIEFAYRCGVIDRLSTQVAVNRIMGSMQDDLAKFGLLDDPQMSIKPVADRFIAAGKYDAASGKCSQLTPKMRGEILTMVDVLMA